MVFNGSADSDQLSVLSTVLDKCCLQAGIAAGHPARERLGRRVIELFQAGMDQPEDLLASLNSSYDEWLGEVGLPSSSSRQAALWASEDKSATTDTSAMQANGDGPSRSSQADGAGHSVHSSPRPLQRKDQGKQRF